MEQSMDEVYRVSIQILWNIFGNNTQLYTEHI